jgi:hypothetical protein
MSAAFDKLSKALIQGAVDALPAGFPLAGENLPFDKPTDGSRWGAVFVFHNPPSPATLGDEGEDAHDGFMQIDLNHKALSGDAASNALADQVAAYFKAGRPLVNGGVKATVVSCGRSRGREVDGWYRVSMTVTWRSRVPRNV